MLNTAYELEHRQPRPNNDRIAAHQVLFYILAAPQAALYAAFY